MRKKLEKQKAKIVPRKFEIPNKKGEKNRKQEKPNKIKEILSTDEDMYVKRKNLRQYLQQELKNDLHGNAEVRLEKERIPCLRRTGSRSGKDPRIPPDRKESPVPST